MCQTHGFFGPENWDLATSMRYAAFEGKLLTALDSEITDSYFSPGVGVNPQAAKSKNCTMSE